MPFTHFLSTPEFQAYASDVHQEAERLKGRPRADSISVIAPQTVTEVAAQQKVLKRIATEVATQAEIASGDLSSLQVPYEDSKTENGSSEVSLASTTATAEDSEEKTPEDLTRPFHKRLESMQHPTSLEDILPNFHPSDLMRLNAPPEGWESASVSWQEVILEHVDMVKELSIHRKELIRRQSDAGMTDDSTLSSHLSPPRGIHITKSLQQTRNRTTMSTGSSVYKLFNTSLFCRNLFDCTEM
eukprot:TRINITY_DN15027_c0_g1_i1.p1 TRINITY_DN15027_c0_g1~~TRINITY_DN15027_c0_g1_i1.p1  ORF type:complete len:243 (-),score=36.32 TRINITY_DN15027_c0_g1_i1:86-814(-)